MDDLVVQVLGRLAGVPVRRGELERPGRMLRWAEAGHGGPPVIMDAALGEPGSLAWAGVFPAIAGRTRVIAYDRAGLGASDPAPVTLDGEVDDLVALIAHAGGPAVLTGHSLGGTLAQLAALARPDLVAGLVLVDPAEEEYLMSLGSDALHEGLSLGDSVLAQYDDGTLEETIREIFAPHARRLTGDEDLQEQIAAAYVSCYRHRWQAAMVRDEHQMFAGSLPLIRQRRAATPLPDMPVVVLSATTGRPPAERQAWTDLHARLAASVPRGRHVVLADTSHAINQERPGEVADAIGAVLDEVARAA